MHRSVYCHHIPAAISSLAVAALVVAFSSRFAIVLPQQAAEVECLNARAFLIDRSDRTLAPGQLVAFKLSAQNPVFAVGTGLVKKVAALPGETVEVTKDGVHVGQRYYPVGSERVIRKLQLDPVAVYRTEQVAEGRFFAVGERETSFDSRYWGTAAYTDVVGRAYALF